MRVSRTALPDGYFHAYSRGTAGVVPFPEDVDKATMLRLMREAERRFAIRVLAGVVMSTHFHLVVASTQSELSKAMHWLKATYARDFNKRQQRFGAVFAERFACRAFRNEQRLANACAYVRANPVNAGICETVGEWPWAYGSWRPDF